MKTRSKVSALIIPALAGSFFAANVLAADITTDVGTQSIKPVLDPVQASSIWNGAYAGLYGGLNWQSVGVMGSSDVDISNQKEFGGYVGINQALGNSIVGGLEWMAGFSGHGAREGGVRVEQDWETSLRARMGYAFEQNLVYGLAGVSATQVEITQGGDSDRNLLTGWTVGAGVERKFTDQLSGRLEYDYSDYGARSFDLGRGKTDADLTGHGLKVGVGFNF